MEIRIDGKAIVDKYEEHKDRVKVSLYLSDSLYRKFKEVCGNAPASRVMEDLMKQLIESIKGQKNKEKK